jgi:hypothetical protein
MSTPSHPRLTRRLSPRISLALLAILALLGWHVPGTYAICNPDEPDCPFPDPEPRDFYCAYPVLTDMSITNIHESGPALPFAYMYFQSAGAPKTGEYADYLGTGLSTPAGAPPQTRYDYDNNAWASNFKGPIPLTLESSRTQWEWSDTLQTSGWGPGGTPYKYGHVCEAVSVGGTRPDLGYTEESVYEDDECVCPPWDLPPCICNPDDYVGGFRIYQRRCETDVWSMGYTRGWTNVRSAAVWGDINHVRYRLWCHTCPNTTSCATGPGVGPDRGPGW